MEMLFKWIGCGLLVVVVAAVMRHFHRIEQERLATEAEIERLRDKWMYEFEQVRLTAQSPLASERARRTGFRVVD